MTNTTMGDSQYIKGTKSRVSKYNTTIYKNVPEDDNDIFVKFRNLKINDFLEKPPKTSIH